MKNLFAVLLLAMVFMMIVPTCIYGIEKVTNPPPVERVDTIMYSDNAQEMINDVKAINTGEISKVVIVKGEIADNILGSLSVGTYISAFFFIFAGLFLRNFFKIRKSVRNENSGTPGAFSWSYYFKHNFFAKMNSIVANLIIAYVCLRFSSDWFGYEVSMLSSLLIGLSFDWFVDYIRKLQKKVPDPATTESSSGVN